MRALSLALFTCLACTAPFSAAEPVHTWPLWDGKETVAEYAQRANLQPTKTLDLGNGVTLELVLIPAGQFIMGTPEPVPVDEDAFRKRIVVGQALLASGAGMLLVMLAVVVIRAIRRKSWPQVSLAQLLVVTAVAGVSLFGGIQWRQAAQELQQGLAEFESAKARQANSGLDEKPAHSVTLTKPFYMGQYEITQAQYLEIQGGNPSVFQGLNNPVESVSWDDANEFCQKLKVATKETVCMPTEAEWEYACRAGTRSIYLSGDQDADLDRVAWYDDDRKNSSQHPVGEKEANGFGLYDMLGNVSELCSDWYSGSYYEASPDTDPKGPAKGEHRVLRGGCWVNSPRYCRVACRFGITPSSREFYYGFRVVVEVPSRTP